MRSQIADPDFYDGMPAVKATANGMSREELRARAFRFLTAQGADSVVMEAIFGKDAA